MILSGAMDGNDSINPMMMIKCEGLIIIHFITTILSSSFIIITIIISKATRQS